LQSTKFSFSRPREDRLGYMLSRGMSASGDPPPQGVAISHVSEGNSQVIVVVGELDMASAPKLEEYVSEFPQAGARELSIDLRAVSFMDSAGLRALARLRETCEHRGCDFAVTCSPSSQVAHIIEISGAGKLLAMREPREN
jgi:anti-sigma B factor antagonist